MLVQLMISTPVMLPRLVLMVDCENTGKGISKDSFVEDICNIDEACGHAKYPQLRHKKRMIYFIIFIMVMDLTHISNVHNLRTMHASGIQLW
jgi:hypothetical protein